MRASVVSVKEGIDLGGDSAKRAGIGAVLGGVIGQVIGGTKGAIIGAVLGGGGALAAKLGEDVDLPAGTILTLRLERALDVTR
jgi:outer membrane lipoprotein SlyB